MHFFTRKQTLSSPLAVFCFFACLGAGLELPLPALAEDLPTGILPGDSLFQLAEKVEWPLPSSPGDTEPLRSVFFVNSYPTVKEVAYVHSLGVDFATAESPTKLNHYPSIPLSEEVDLSDFIPAPPQVGSILYRVDSGLTSYSFSLLSVPESKPIAFFGYTQPTSFSGGWTLQPDTREFVVGHESKVRYFTTYEGHFYEAMSFEAEADVRVAFYPGQWIAAATEEKFFLISLWDSSPVRTYPLPSPVFAMSFTQRGKVVLSSLDQKIRRFDPARGQFQVIGEVESNVRLIRPHPIPTPKSDVVYFSPRTGVIAAFDVETSQALGEITLNTEQPFHSIDLSADGRKLVAATSSEVFFVNVQSSEVWGSLTLPSNRSHFEKLKSDPLFNLLVLESDLSSKRSNDPSFGVRRRLFESLVATGLQKEVVTGWASFLEKTQPSESPLLPAQRLEEELKLMQKLVRGYHKLHPENAGFSQFAQKVEKIFQKAEGHLKRRDQLIAAINQADAVLEKEFDSSESSDHQWIEAIDFLYEQILSELQR